MARLGAPSPSGSSCSEPWVHCDVDGEETVGSLWLSPKEILCRSANGSMSFFPPQFYILQRLCAFPSASSALSGADWFSTPKNRSLPIVMRPELLDGTSRALALPFDSDHVQHPGPDNTARHRLFGWSPQKGSMDLRLEMNKSAASPLHGKRGRGWQW